MEEAVDEVEGDQDEVSVLLREARRANLLIFASLGKLAQINKIDLVQQPIQRLSLINGRSRDVDNRC